MPTKIIRDHGHITALAVILGGRKLPLTVSWTQGASKTDAQNRLAFQWYGDISRQLGDQTIEDVRAECKVRFGAPILCAENDAFRQSWVKGIGVLPYADQVELVRNLDVPMTRLMKVSQMTDYLDAMQREYLPQGVRLTDPEALKYQEEFE